MRTRHDPSIRQKLTRIILVTCGVSILMACTVLAAYDLLTFRGDLANSLAETAGITGSNTTAALAFGDTQSARETLSSLRAQPHIVEACIYTRDGSVFATYARRDSDPQFTPPPPGPEGSVATWHDMVLFEPIRLNGERIGTIYLKSDLEGLYARAEHFAEIVLIVILASFVTAYLLALRLQRAISGPILELARTASAVSVEKDYSIRAKKRSTDEIGFLFDRFNDMLGQIQAREGALQWAHDELEVRVDERTRELQKEVAERKEAEQELEEQKSFLKALIDNCPLGIAALGPDNTVQICNPAFEKLFHYRQQEIFGRSIIDLLAPDELRAEMASTGDMMVQGTPVHRVTRRRRSDGSLVDVETFSAPIFAGQQRLGALAMYQDITERQRTEEVQQRLAAIVENTGDFVGQADPEGRGSYINPAGLRMLGAARIEDVIGRPIWDFHTPESAARVRDEGLPTAMRDGMWTGETNLVTLDGQVVPVSQSIFIERAADRTVKHTTTIMRDLTERKRAQQELEEQKRFLNSLIDNCPMAIVALDANDTVKICNPAFEKLFHYRQQDVLGRYIVDVLSPTNLRAEMESAGVTLRQGTPVHRVTQRRRSDGSVVDVEVFAALIATEEKALGCLAMYQDITERKRTQQELEKQKSFLSSVIETSPVGIVAIDANGTVQMCNPAFEKVFGYRYQDLRDQRLSDLLTPAERKPEMESILKAYSEGRPTHSVTQRKRSDGNLVDVETFSVPLKEDGKIAGAVLLYQDISERKRAQLELEDRTNFLNSLIENIPMGIVTTAIDDTVQMCNHAFEGLFGYCQQDVLGRSIIDVLAPDELRTEMQSTKTKMIQRRPVRMTTRRKRKDGVLLDVEVLAAPILRGEERSGNLVIYQDITERKRAQQELEEQKRFLNSLIDNCPVAIVALDADGTVKMCNPAFESLFRYRRQDILGRSIVDVLSPAESRTEMESTGDSLKQGTPVHLTTQRRRSDGSLVDVEIFAALIAADEQSLGSLAMYQDITERRRAERELEERTSFLNSLIENTPVGIAAIDADGAVQMCNPAFEILFGYRQQDILGRQLRDLLTTTESLPEVASNTESLQQGKTTHVVTRRTRSDGSLVDVEAYSVPLGAEGTYTGAVLLYQDITERKQAEEALLRAKEAAEAASRAKSEFLANMSHEIRTPMNGIIGMTELALDTGLTAEQREYLGMVKTSADSLLTLINDILDFSKIEAGKLDVEMIDFPFKQSLGETVKALAFRAHQKGLELAWHVQPGVPERLKGDGSRLRQVLVNLLGNAVKFTERGEIVVDVEKEAEDESGLLLHFRVRDTGIGIPEEKQKLVFEAFTQADSSATRKYGGTGLGLAITSRLVELMGGKIWLESEMGRGSTFHFTCRFGFAETYGQPVVPPDPEMTHNLPVLVVDDNETNRFILVEMLSAWRMRPQAVTGGKAALAALERAHQEGEPFRLVITDMQMPEMDGFALSEEIRRSSRFAIIPILLLSSSGQQGEAAHCRQLGIASYLTKPVQPSELLDAVLAALSQPVEIEDVSPAKQDVPGEGTTGMKVLLAEDNAVNRKLVTTLLEKRGHSVVVAENGQSALEALERESVDLVLMDVQMPVMDGFEAIRAIRNNEQSTGAHLPIIALTAHAMQGDRERCLEVGADDYVTKPIRTSELLAAMDRLRSPKDGPGPVEQPVAKAPASSVLDVAAALERVEGDRELLEELVQILAEECPKNMAEIRHALEARDARLLERLAHTIKGSSANLGASGVARAAFELEKHARSGALEKADELVENLQREVGQLLPEIESFCRKVAP